MAQEGEAASKDHSWRDEISDLMRGVGGAAIIGVPLLFTMEVWQGAVTASSQDVALLLLLAVIVCTGYNLLSGFREDSGLLPAFMDAVEAVAIGLVLSLVVLLLIGVIDAGTPLPDALRKIGLEALPLAVGASVANQQFDSKGSDSEDGEPQSGGAAIWREAGIAAAGSLIFAGSIAPTEEIMQIAVRATWGQLTLLVVFSLLLSYGMIFVADFTGSDRRKKSSGLLQSPVGETLLAYSIALAVALGAILTFHGVHPGESFPVTLAATVVLAFPAAIGGAAGRLLV